jgi:hypothetical protein
LVRGILRVAVSTAALCAVAAPRAPARAEEHGLVLAPEVNVFVKLTDQARIYLLGDVTDNVTKGLVDGELGAHLDFTLKPLFRPSLQDANWERDRYLWVRVGYMWVNNGGSRDDPSIERRIILQATQRAELPNDVWLVQRLQAEFRDIDGAYSQRYRYRLGVERAFDAGGTAVVPYAQAEMFYDTRYDSWTRQLYQVGAEIELTKQWRIEPYVSRQDDSRSASANVNTIGLIFKHFR